MIANLIAIYIGFRWGWKRGWGDGKDIDLRTTFEHHGTDKHLHGWHDLYQQILPWRGDVERVLEVGIGTLNPDAVSTTVGYFPDDYEPGASLRAWADWFPNAHITGMDNQQDAVLDNTTRITYLWQATGSRRRWITLHGPHSLPRPSGRKVSPAPEPRERKNRPLPFVQVLNSAIGRRCRDRHRRWPVARD